jgi:hypothetical protein
VDGGRLGHLNHARKVTSATFLNTRRSAEPSTASGRDGTDALDLTPYLSAYGQQVFDNLQNASIVQGLFGGYSGLTFAQLTKPQYQVPESIPVYDRLANQLIMGTGGTPTAPLLIDQGANGTLDGTPNAQPGIGPGDGVMIAGDVRSLAREYCAAPSHRATPSPPSPCRRRGGAEGRRGRRDGPSAGTVTRKANSGSSLDRVDLG